MSSKKVSLSLDEALLTSVREHCGRSGLSRYVNDALRRRLQRDRIADLLVELEQEHCAIGPEVMQGVREAWPAPAIQHRGT